MKALSSIGISVENLKSMVDFYKKAAGFEVIDRYEVHNDMAGNQLFGKDNLHFQVIQISAETTLIELMHFVNETNISYRQMPVVGPGLTHICFQSLEKNPAFPKFIKAGMKLISRSDAPVDLAGAGIKYAYGCDPEGNIIELEQMVEPPKDIYCYLAHAAYSTHSIEELKTFYSMVLFEDKEAPDHFRFRNNPKLNMVVGVDGVDVYGTWLRNLDVEIEIWQYLHPETPRQSGQRSLFSRGYNLLTYSVHNIGTEYERLVQKGVEFISEPVEFMASYQVIGYDIFGNPFRLSQSI